MSKDQSITPELLQANPALAVAITLFSLLVLMILVGCLAMWLWALLRWSSGKTLLSTEPWQPRSWGFVDLVLAALLVLVGQVLGMKLWADANGLKLREMKENQLDSLAAMAVGSASLIAAMTLVMGWLLMRYSATFSHLGMSLSRVFQRVGLGLGAAVMWLPIVMIIMVSVSVGFGKDYDHPLIKRLNEDGTAQAYLLAVFCAVIAAPLVEEFLFRVLLQGWLQSIPWTFRSTWWLLGANRQQSRLVMGGAVDVPVVAQVLDTLPAETLTPEPPANPYLPTLTVTDPGTVGTADPNGEPPVVTLNEPKPPIWPVFVAGTLFGLAHYDYGLSFIPLILLGIVLGFLYRATHSIWPCFVLHFCLNSFSMAGLGISLLMEAAK